MNLSELISNLKKVQKEVGPINPEVLLSSDEEGNSWGTINPKGSFTFDGKRLILYPWESHLPEDMP